MNQAVKLSKAISYVVIVCAVLAFLAIWPLGLLQQTYVSKSNELIAMESDPVNVERNVTQMFVGEGGELSAVDLYVCNDMRGETITFRLYDASYSEIFNNFFVVKENQEFPGFVHIPVGYDLVKDQEYYFTIEGLSADMTVAYEERETSTSIVNGFMSYGGIEIQRYNVIIRYEYSNPFAWWQVLLFGAGIAGVTAGLLWLVHMLFAKKITDREVKVQNVLRVTLCPVIVLAALALCLLVFPGRRFGTGAFNYAFYGGSILLLTALLLFGINYKRTGMKPLIDTAVLAERFPEILQSVCFAGAIWYCYEYMNGLYDIHHSFAIRRMLIWFLLGLICTYSKKELLRIWNLVYLIGMGFYAYFYAKPYLDIEQEGELYKLQAYIMVAGGFVIFQLVISLIRWLLKKETITKKISVPYLLLLALLLGLMIRYSNSQEWTGLAAALFGMFYLRMLFWKKSDRILLIFADGLIFNFVYMVGYCLLHRPYHRYIYYRYGLGYHTVTMTSVYLTLILCAVFARFYMKFRENRKISDAWLEVVLAAVANIYLFLTLSRTGYIAAIVTEGFMLILFACMAEKKKITELLKNMAVITGATIIAFPIVFTMTRIMPAVANDPILSEIEESDWSVKKGTPSDSELYIDLERFLKTAGYKVFGLNSEQFAFIDATEESLKEDYFYNAFVKELRMMWNPEEFFVVNDRILLAGGEDSPETADVLDDMTNGRIDIFKAYIAQWNMTGHEDMEVLAPNGELIVHAHNIFLQVIHDHGLVAGVVFIVFGILSFILAMFRFIKDGSRGEALSVAVLLAFAVAGMAEWLFHICNPFGFSVFIVITPLLFRNRNIRKNEQE